MKHINYYLALLFSTLLFSASLNAQTDVIMKTIAQSVEQEMSKKGFSLSDHVILPVSEFNMGYNTIFFPGNNYLVCLSDDLTRKANIQMSAKAQYDQAEINALFKQFKVGATPDDLKIVQGASLIFQELSLKDVLIPIDYDFEFKMEDKDIQSDSKVNLMVFYKSVDNTSNSNAQNKSEQYHHEAFKKLQQRSLEQAEKKKNEKKPETLEETVLYEAAKKGFSLASQQAYKADEFPSEIKVSLQGGNTYMLALLNTAKNRVQLMGTPDKQYNLLAKMTDGMEELPAFETQENINLSIQNIDFRSSLYAATYTLKSKITSDDTDKAAETMIFIFYKSFENLGSPEYNKAEDFYSKKAADAMIAGAEAQVKAFENTMGYEFVSLEELVKETEGLSPTSPSGLKYLNGKMAVDKWMEALVRESHGDANIYKTFDAMHEDWQSNYTSYKSTSTADQLIKALDGGFKHQGFTKDDLLVVDHVIDNKVVTRYYFKIKKCADYGRIIPKHDIKDGKLHITPWQKAVVPNK